MDIASLETIIKRYIKLPNYPSGTGWYPILCKVCNDHGRKGPRGGFRFDDNKVAYHCFNCGHSTVFDPDTQKNMPEKMIQVLTEFNVPEDEWKAVLYANLKARDQFGSSVNQAAPAPIQSVEPAVVPLPSHFYPLSSASPNDQWAQLASAYLDAERGVDPKSYGFMLSHPNGDPQVDKWAKRVIIPIYKENQLIFYVGRDLTGKHTQKYLSPSYSKEKVLFGFDELFRQTDEPLYIVEGWFDAWAINGVAILGNEISDAHATWLNRSQRRKIYIPDRLGDGWVAAERALQLGWDVSTPEIGDCKDISAAVMKYGRMYVIKSINDKAISASSVGTDLAKAILGFYCSYDPTNKDRSKKKDRATSSSKRTRR